MQVDQYSNWESRALNPQPSLRFFAFALALSAVALSPGLVRAQLQSGVNPLAGNAAATSGAQTPTQMGPGGQPPIFGDKVPDRGWDGLANLLEAISPSVDTRVPPSAADIARRIESLLAAGRAVQALQEIDKREAAEAGRSSPGTDVQLMFLRARALVALNRVDEAENIYRQMTMRFPELPEPWNNLAAIYASRDDLDQARRALETAIMIYPDYAIAHANLGDIQLKLALRAYQRALDLGVTGGVRSRIREINAMLVAQPGPTDTSARPPVQTPVVKKPGAPNTTTPNTATPNTEASSPGARPNQITNTAEPTVR